VSSPPCSRAAAAYRLALRIKDDVARIAAEYPKVAAKLDAAARLLIAEGRKAEGGSN
jgi:hypothetical protein